MTGRRRRPRRWHRVTARRRLTLLYAGLFVLCGIALLAFTNAAVHRTSSARAVPVPGAIPGQPPPAPVVPGGASSLVTDQRNADLHGLLVVSLVALVLMTIASVALGSMIARRVLRPLRAMTEATRQISADDLSQRLAVVGPQDELTELGDTIDGLLGRLEGAFAAQRHFVANASHELRTPLTVAQALLEMVLSDPSATVETFRTTCEHVLETSAQQEELIDALLILARGERGLDRREAVDLAAVAGDVVAAQEADASARGVHLVASLASATCAGDARLIARLAANLIENGVRHNVPGGRVRVLVDTQDGAATLEVANTGPVVPPTEVDRLLRPFQRLGADRVGAGDGLGLGLSIVAAIAKAHGAVLDIHPGTTGGLEVAVRFPKGAPDRQGGSSLTPPPG